MDSLKKLVREMGVIIRDFLHHDDLSLQESYLNDSRANVILNSPEVRKIMNAESEDDFRAARAAKCDAIIKFFRDGGGRDE